MTLRSPAVTDGPTQHDDSDRRDPHRPAPRGADGGRGARGDPRSVFISPAGNIAFLVVLTACAVGVLAYHGREVGMIGVGSVNALALLMYLAFRGSFDRVRASPVEGLVSWLVWTLLIGASTAFYALDWRILGACVLALVLVMSFANMYLVVMRSDVVDDWIRQARDDNDPGAGDDDDHPPG